MISVIIPVYNVAAYIEPCLESVRCQEYTDYEVLIVDDCGQDESVLIAQRFIESHGLSDKGWKILHHTHNRDLGAARNTGLKEARGEWIFFLDSDDTLPPDSLSTLYATATQQPDIEIAIGELESVDEKGNLHVPLANGLACPFLKVPDGVYDDDLWERYRQQQFAGIACNKLISADFVHRHQLSFKEGMIHEDDLWTFCCLCNLRKVAVTNHVTYHYLIRSTSIMGSQRSAERKFALNTIIVNQVDYCVAHGHGDNKRVFDHLYPALKRRLLGLIAAGEKEVVHDMVSKLQKAHFWSPRQLWRMVPARRDMLILLARIRPASLAIYLLSCMNRGGYC